MKAEDEEEIRRLCRILSKPELATAFLRIAGSFDTHYQIESTLREILEKRQEEKEAEHEKAEYKALKAYESLYKEMTEKYGKGLKEAPLPEKIELMTRLTEWSELVQKGVKMTKKHDDELFGGKQYEQPH